ncbi:DUF2621 domain-containing protein [Ornithinibacillus sp. BX22]|uniref:DUF2621 domain-containing protein n=2 Tax=Ornithinibacillus TaxID=484508 RepID=A0A923L400_9BACI|nr:MULTISPECIES: DUF2621 domain-containing protein [Ornithinibacillus]MBC5636062.1 DUF2621 domain-containing protein [Ornithinibacillus hominis]MBS3679930.1 DUF2621 domain-containing protein [Ornithinibacillus massiliensis]
MSYFIVFWGFFMIGFMAIGGYFMFRKFLKQLPKEDGKSMMDWELHYIEKSKHMWNQEEKDLLEELVSPVPELFRDVARQKIASKIGQVALEQGMSKINQDVVIEGYILATPKRDHKFLRKKLKEKQIDVSPYEHLFKRSKEDYRTNWQASYKKSQ